MAWRHLGSGGVAPLIPNQDTRWCDWSASHPGCLHPRKMSPVPRLLFSKYKTVNLEENSKHLRGRCVKIDTSVIINVVCCDRVFFSRTAFRNFVFCCPCILVRLWVNDQTDAQLSYIKRLLLYSEWRHHDVLVIRLTLHSIRQHNLFYF